MPDSEYRYDVFISYSHKDGDWVLNTLVPRLEQGGLKVCIDHRDFVPGKAVLLNVQDGIRQSRHILLILSPNWVESQWAQFEAEMARSSDPEGIKLRTIPLLWKRCTIPEHIATLTYVDFTQKQNLDTAWWQLLSALGVPSDKIRTPKKVHPARHARRPRPKLRRLTKKENSLLLFSLIVFLVMIVSELVTIWVIKASERDFDRLPTETSPIVVLTSPVPSLLPTLTATSATPTSTYTPTETATIAPTATMTPTNFPGCIDTNMWKAFTTESGFSPQMQNGCWLLSDWGISFYNGDFSFLDGAFTRVEKYGLFRPVPWISTIEFTFHPSYLRNTEIWMGITRSSDTINDGVFFVYQASGSFDVRYTDTSGRVSLYSNDIKIQPLKGQYLIKMTLAGERLSISVNDAFWRLSDLSVPYLFPNFFVGYQSFPNGSVNVHITAPVVTEK